MTTKWRQINASVIGLGHSMNKVPCQDASISYSSLKDNFYCSLVSDGCGSGKFSHFGSRLLCNIIPEYVNKNFDSLYEKSEDEIKRIFLHFIDESLASEINKLVEEKKVEIDKFNPDRFVKDKEYAFEIKSLFDATLLCVAIKDTKCLVLHCGDGVIGKIENSTISILSCERKVRGHENETWYPSTLYFEESDDYLFNFRVFKFPDIKNINGFILISDGSENSLVKNTGDGVQIFSINNVSIPLEIAVNETQSKGSLYLNDLIKKQYRLLTLDDGEHFITDDDCSVAVICKNETFIDSAEEFSFDTAKELKTERIERPVVETKKPENLLKPKKPLEESIKKHVKPYISASYSKEKEEFTYDAIAYLLEYSESNNLDYEKAREILLTDDRSSEFKNHVETILTILKFEKLLELNK